MTWIGYSSKRLALALCLTLFTTGVSAQIYDQDSLTRAYATKPRYLYLKPVVGLHWTRSTLRGKPPFMGHSPFDNRNVRWGLLIGRQTGRVGIEAGVTTFPVYTGFRFTSNDDFTIGGGTRVRYWQFPVTVQYALLNPTKRLQVHLLAGAAFHKELGESFLPPRLITSAIRTNLNGTTSRIDEIRNTHYRKTFVSALIGLSINYRVLKRLNLDVQISRPISANSILTKEIQLRQNSDPTVYRATAQAGAGGVSVLLGIQYRLDLTRSYGRYRNVFF